MRARERRTLSESPEVQIEVQQLDAMRALRLLHRLTKIVAPAVARIGSGKSLAEMDVGSLGAAADALFAHFSEQDLEEITRLLFADAIVRAESKEIPCFPLGFTLAFDGHVDLLLKAVLFALELNFGPLFESARGLLGSRVAPLPGVGLDLPEHVAAVWPAERLMLERVASQMELETHYSIDDVLQRNLALDAKQLAEQDAQKANS